MKIIVLSDKQKAYALEEIRKLSYDRVSVVEIKPESKNRSLAQNALFHKWCGVAAIKRGEQTGEYFSPRSWKFHFKDLFLGYDTIETPDGIKQVLRETSKQKTNVMAAFMTKVDHYCGEFHIQLPHPDDFGWIMGGKRNA